MTNKNAEVKNKNPSKLSTTINCLYTFIYVELYHKKLFSTVPHKFSYWKRFSRSVPNMCFQLRLMLCAHVMYEFASKPQATIIIL